MDTDLVEVHLKGTMAPPGEISTPILGRCLCIIVYVSTFRKFQVKPKPLVKVGFKFGCLFVWHFKYNLTEIGLSCFLL